MVKKIKKWEPEDFELDMMLNGVEIGRPIFQEIYYFDIRKRGTWYLISLPVVALPL